METSSTILNNTRGFPDQKAQGLLPKATAAAPGDPVVIYEVAGT
jgi:hypothetical protein